MTQDQALDILKLGHNAYITGPAGSGKTHTLNAYINYLKENEVEVGITASTGIAATHMNGVTIHSWAGIGIKDDLSEHDLEALEEKEYLHKRINKAKVLIIDEVSMLHDFRLDMVDRVCRALKRSEEPFGGIQVVLSGDFFQLPPISRGSEEANFIHKSDVWGACGLRVCYLEEQYRQTSGDYALDVLGDIRRDDVTEDTMNHLRRRYKKEPDCNTGKEEGEKIVATKLYTHNADVDRINERELEKIETGSKIYEMKTRGRGPLVETLKKSCLAPERLALKKDAQVMFVKNNFDEGYVNGTLGKVIDFDKMGAPIVETFSAMSGKQGKKVKVEQTSWSIEEDGKVKAEIIQLPLRLAWAITVHKSQGMSLDAVEVDLSKSFVPGMGYVALSRVRSLGGLKLLGLNQVAMQVTPEVLGLDQGLQNASQNATKVLSEMKEKEKEKAQKEYLDSISPSDKEKREKARKRKEAGEKKISTHIKTKMLVEKGYTLEEMAQERSMTTSTIINHLEKLLEEGDVPDMEYLKPKGKRYLQIKIAFEKAKDTKLTPVKKKLDDTFTFEELRLARLFL